MVPAVVREQLQQRGLQRQADGLEVARVLGLGIDAYGAVRACALGSGQVDDLLQRGHLETVIELHIRRADRRDAFTRTQRLQLGQREILHEPARDRLPVDGFGGLARRELGAVGHIGRGLLEAAVGREDGDGVLMPRHQHAIARDDQVGLDEVGARAYGLPVGLQRVLWPQRRCAAVRDQRGPGRPVRGLRWGIGGLRRGAACQQQAGGCAGQGQRAAAWEAVHVCLSGSQSVDCARHP